MKGPFDIMSQSTTAGSQRSQVDFSEYMWMGEELEEFDKKVEEELEQEFIEACFEQLLKEEEQEWYYPPQNQQNNLVNNMQNLQVQDQHKEMVLPTIVSHLNPDAPVFVPRGMVINER